MIIDVGNVQSRIVAGTQVEIDWVATLLTYHERRYAYGEPYDHEYCLYKPRYRVFPTGMLHEIRAGFERSGYPLEIRRTKPPPCEVDREADLQWLRPYQREAVQACVERQRGIVHAPTGSGKSEIVVGLTRTMPCNWVFLVHRTGLVQQQADRYTLRTGFDAGRIGEGQWNVPKGTKFVCASFQSVYAAYKAGDDISTRLMHWADAIAIDECHTLPSTTYSRVAFLAKNAYWRIGLSGTPLARSDSRSIFGIAATGPVIYRVTPDRLIEAGVLAVPDIKMTRIRQSDMGDWLVAYRSNIVQSEARNKLVVDCVKRSEKPCLVFVSHLKHGKILEKMILNAGLHCDFVWGDHSVEWRRAQISRLEHGQLDVLVCSVIFQEGVDIPCLRSVVMASAGKSVIASLQKIGRGMRIAKDKTTFQVWDFFDADGGLLERHSRRRAETYESEGYKVAMI